VKSSGKRSALIVVAIVLVVIVAAAVVLVGRLPATDTRPNIVLISIDTVRADHLSTYGYDRNTSPNLTALLEQGVLYRNVISQAPWTLPSVASMMTSLYPSEHGANSAHNKLHETSETLAETLGRAGYHTIGITTHMFVNAAYGFGQGFADFDESQVRGHDAVTAEAVTEIALSLLEKHRRKPFFQRRPVFLWVHYFDPHFTYVRHPEYGFAAGYDGKLPSSITQERLDEALHTTDAGRGLTQQDLDFIEAVYDEEIAYTDHWVGELRAGIEDLALDSPTVYVVTSDHGEYFLERGRFFHGKDVYNELIRVPLVVSGAIDEVHHGRQVDRYVEVLSIPRTVVELLGIEDHGFAGENLLALESDPSTLRPLYAEGSYAWGRDQQKKAVVYAGWKLINNLDDDRYELYNLFTDFDERQDLWRLEDDETAAAREYLKSQLDDFPAHRATTAAEVELSDEQKRHLRSLGYVQ